MKIIVSHDVDLITALESCRNFGPIKLIARSSIELIIGKIGIAEFLLRFGELFKNKLHNLEELMEFDKQNNVPSTFFVGVNHGLGLCYSLKNVECWIKRIMERGFDVGVHGIEFANLEGIKKEYDTFRKLSGLQSFGVRMHYLRSCENTLRFLNEAGYLFDSTIFDDKDVSKTGNLWEFPLHMMDTHLFNKGARWQNQTLEQVKETTKVKIDRAYSSGIKYFAVLFHDRYFSNSFESWKEWYVWIVNYLKSSGFKFATYREAIQELKEKA